VKIDTEGRYVTCPKCGEQVPECIVHVCKTPSASQLVSFSKTSLCLVCGATFETLEGHACPGAGVSPYAPLHIQPQRDEALHARVEALEKRLDAAFLAQNRPNEAEDIWCCEMLHKAAGEGYVRTAWDGYQGYATIRFRVAIGGGKQLLGYDSEAMTFRYCPFCGSERPGVQFKDPGE